MPAKLKTLFNLHISTMDKAIIEEKIWAFLDGSLTDGENAYIQTKIVSDADWQTCYKEILFFHNELQQAEPEVPSLRFTQSVMEQLAVHKIQPEWNRYINKKIINTIGFSFILLLVITLIFSVIYFSRDTDTKFSNPFESITVNVDIAGKAAPATDSFSKILLNDNLVMGLLSGLLIVASFFIGMLLRKKEKNIFY